MTKPTGFPDVSLSPHQRRVGPQEVLTGFLARFCQPNREDIDALRHLLTLQPAERPDLGAAQQVQGSPHDLLKSAPPRYVLT